MVTPSTSQTRPDRVLTEDLITLAGTPDDGSSVPLLLRTITRSTADLLPPVVYASVTIRDDDAYTTVAVSNDLALAVDEAQYADRDGPCLDALRTSEPTVVPRIGALVRWPGFRTAAHGLGLRASLSIPLFAGRGTAIAALNLYGHDLYGMAVLSAAVLAVFEGSDQHDAESDHDGRDAGSVQLTEGLIGAFGVRARVQRALGMIMAGENTTADRAYAILRSYAATAPSSLPAAADSMFTGGRRRPV